MYTNREAGNSAVTKVATGGIGLTVLLKRHGAGGIGYDDIPILPLPLYGHLAIRCEYLAIGLFFYRSTFIPCRLYYIILRAYGVCFEYVNFGLRELLGHVTVTFDVSITS